MTKKILVILGHPSKKSYCNGLADAYAKGAKKAGAEVQRLNITDLKFDPILWDKNKHKIEPDLIKAQKMIKWAEHLVFVYPTWWGGMPALMKGFFDKCFTSGFAFRYRKDGPWWDKLLSGRSAHLIVTMDAPPFFYKLMTGSPGHKMMKHSILGFCGIKTVKITDIGTVINLNTKKLKEWLGKVEQYGSQMK